MSILALLLLSLSMSGLDLVGIGWVGFPTVSKGLLLLVVVVVGGGATAVSATATTVPTVDTTAAICFCYLIPGITYHYYCCS